MLSSRKDIIIRFNDADPAGVVFYPRAIALAHAAVEDMIRGSALGWEAWFASPAHAAPLRRAEADFFLPMKPGRRFDVHSRVDAIGESSVTFVVEFVDTDRHTAARIRAVHVLIDKKTGQPLPLTGTMRAVFAAVS
jgi:acyl-CoA thioesterase FadM